MNELTQNGNQRIRPRAGKYLEVGEGSLRRVGFRKRRGFNVV